MKRLIFALVILTILFAGCSKTPSETETAKATENVSFSVGNTTESTTEETNAVPETEKSTNPTTTKFAVAKSEDKTTTAQNTTKKHTTTTRPNTTAVQTTVPKETTTKKVTTTKAPYWCDEGGTHHSCEVGVGGWVSSYDEAVDNALEYISAHDTSGNFTVQQCLNCGKYTVYVSVD